MWSRKLALFGLAAVLGCGPEGIEVTCLIAEPIEPGICRVLPSGLVLREQGGMTTVGMLLDDGTIEQLGPLPEAIDCFTDLAHDPETGKLWWFESSAYASPPRIHQLDLESGAEDWQRELTHEGFSRVNISSMVFHEGALILAGQAVVFDDSDPSGPYAVEASLLERLDANGASVWAQLGQLGFGLQNETQPMQWAVRLLGIDGALAFLGSISHPDPETDEAARTLAIADLATGELLATKSMGNIEPWSPGFTEFGGGGDILLLLDGQLGGLDGTPVHTEIVAFSSLGQELWRVDFIWSGFIIADFAQIVWRDSIVHIATATASGYTPDVPRSRVVVRSLGGDVQCDGGLPELTELGQPSSQRAWGVRGDRIVLAAEFDDRDLAWVLRRKPE